MRTNLTNAVTSLTLTHSDNVMYTPRVDSPPLLPDTQPTANVAGPTQSQSVSAGLIEYRVPEQLTQIVVDPPSTLDKLQEFEGVVLEVGRQDFRVRVVDLAHQGSGKFEEATFPLTDVSRNDLSLVREGAVFRWIIGMREYPLSKRRERVSNIVFRRLKPWTKREIADVREAARRLADAFRRR